MLLFVAVTSLVHAAADISDGYRGPTPYDRYMLPVNNILQHLNGASPDFTRVEELLSTAYGFDYAFEGPYIFATPEETEARRAGDCKAKSLWLAKAMNDPSIRLVVGRASGKSNMYHAWLLWKNSNRWWILDPAKSFSPIPSEQVRQDEYIGSYYYDRTGSYSYTATMHYFKPVRLTFKEDIRRFPSRRIGTIFSRWRTTSTLIR
jgi:hypothetical protein